MNVQKTYFQLLGKSGPQNQMFTKKCHHFPAQTAQNHYNFPSKLTPGILIILPVFLRKWKSSAITTHTNSRAGGKDYGSFNKLPQIKNPE